jgi:hypothetical protein
VLPAVEQAKTLGCFERASEFQRGATIGNRTRDLFLTMEALYQLSYRGVCGTFRAALYAYVRFTQELSRRTSGHFSKITV